MNKVYDRPTLNMSAIMSANATEVLTDILVSMKNAVGGLLAEKTYIAIQSGILAGTPEDFGVVRYSAHLKKDYKANPDWVKLPKEDQPNFVKYFESPPVFHYHPFLASPPPQYSSSHIHHKIHLHYQRSNIHSRWR